MKTHPLLQQLGIEKVYVDEENQVTNAPDSVCLMLGAHLVPKVDHVHVLSGTLRAAGLPING